MIAVGFVVVVVILLVVVVGMVYKTLVVAKATSVETV